MKVQIKAHIRALCVLSLSAGLSALALTPTMAVASSHMDAPLITLDPAANTTDVYAFVSSIGTTKYLTTALAVYPFEEPSIGPNLYNFDPNVRYEILVATGSDIKTGNITYTYQFDFKTTYKNQETIAISYLGPIQNVGDSNQNLVQTYTVTKIDHRTGAAEVLGKDLLVPPNNQGITTPEYNIMNNGDMVAKPGVTQASQLDTYTSETIFSLKKGYMVFAGQRDDGFYANVQSIFDLDVTYSGPETPLDSQAGFNVHTIVLNIPVSDIGGDQQIVGVWATTSRKRVSVLGGPVSPGADSGYVQVGRQGNPLFCELLVGVEDKDRYNETPATDDSKFFAQYALAPQLAVLLGDPANLQTNRTDIAGIFIPDLIKVDLSTGPAHLADNNDSVFNRLSIFGGDTLVSKIQSGFGNGVIPGGWPNGRRFGDDVAGIAVVALKSDLRTNPPTIFQGFNPATFTLGGVNANDITYNGVFPFAATPHNGRNNAHHTQ
ncbi:MAG: DUF4331 domain-containing protein [Verrucomicrobia bacterium]|nr:DUF4331 domain-containing protein [Verrucomicrobiota bacterium]MBV8274485.1 DUF4331 domain-containing protein [Verrucomicrobiota bacterium]